MISFILSTTPLSFSLYIITVKRNPPLIRKEEEKRERE